MPGVLHIVATPIGNLDDISQRAIRTLASVQLIAAEDTRHSRVLLGHLGIDTPMISCHEHNEEARSARIVEVLEAGGDVALISDAGTPLISDPGYRVVRAVRAAGYRVSPVPGANSAIAALSAAGIATTSFHFYGFLPAKKNQRAARLQELRAVDGTLVLFESSHRIKALLSEIAQHFAGRHCVLAKELTKLHERFLDGPAPLILEQLQADEALTRGEFVVLIDNAGAGDEARAGIDEAGLLRVLLDEMPLKAAVRVAVRISGGKKNELYQQALQMRAAGEAKGGD